MFIGAINPFRTPKINNLPSVRAQICNKNTDLKQSCSCDIIKFEGMSPPSQYDTPFQYLAVKIIDASKKKYKVDGSLLSASKIDEALEQMEQNNTFYPDYKRSSSSKIKWKSYIPQDIRDFSIDKINEAREKRMLEWKTLLDTDNPNYVSDNADFYDFELYEKLKKDKALRFVIWNTVSGELSDNNRHIPVPLNTTALLETIKGFENILPKDRAVRCHRPSFINIYTHRLRDNLLIEMNLSENDAVWVKMPSILHDRRNKEKNIHNLEILSCKNWCTRSSVDKAEAALEDGDFYIYLERDKDNLWEPIVGMTTSRGKIDQIQGVENNNIVPLHLCDEIEDFIESSKLKCNSGIIDEGPKAREAIMISKKLNEVDPITKKTFYKAIKDDDAVSIFKFLNVDCEILEDGMLAISNYKPNYFTGGNGIIIPYSMFGINEDLLLKDVKIINGDLILDNPRTVQNSRITVFPPNLEKISGRVSCSKEQYEKFKDDITRVLGGKANKLYIHW